MLLPLTNAQRVEKFGRFDFIGAPTAGNPEGIRILGGWAEKNIGEASCRQLEYLGHSRVNLHRSAIESFLGLWADWDKAGLLKLIHRWNGSYVPRYKRGRAPSTPSNAAQPAGAALSNHSWGTAFDLNANEYPLGKPIDPADPFCQLFPLARKRGWFCGADFRGRPDPMHFEFCGALETFTVAQLDAARRLLAGELGHTRELQAAIGVAADGHAGPQTIARARQILGQ